MNENYYAGAEVFKEFPRSKKLDERIRQIVITQYPEYEKFSTISMIERVPANWLSLRLMADVWEVICGK